MATPQTIVINRITLILFIGFSFWGCEEEQPEEVDTTPPIIIISSHNSGQTVNEIVTITVATQDNEGISKVEFFIDESLVFTDSETPYEYEWNTTQYEDGSEHIVKVVSYDNSDNSTTSQPITLVVDNSTSNPVGVNVTSVTYSLTEMTIYWELSTDGDFSYYQVLYAESENGDKESIQTYTDKTDNSHTITDFNPLVENWFWVQVSDTLGYKSIGSGMTNEIDSPPTQSELNPILYEDGSFLITWSQNNEYDFQSYTLYESLAENMNDEISIYNTENRLENAYNVTNIDVDQYRYYRIIVKDVWGLQSISNIDVGYSQIKFKKVFCCYYRGADCVQQTTDGGYIIAGGMNSLTKTDNLGNEEWVLGLDNGSTSSINYIQQTSEGGYIVIGTNRPYGGGGDYDPWLTKVDIDGNEQWSKVFYPGNDQNNGGGSSVQQTTDGGYIIAGSKTDSSYWDYYGGSWNYYQVPWLIKTDIDGNEEWNTIPYTGSPELDFVQQTEDGGYVGSGGSYNWFYLFKTDSQGNLEWINSWDSDVTIEWDDWNFNFKVKSSLDQTTDGGYIILYTNVLIKTDSQGNQEWIKEIYFEDSGGFYNDFEYGRSVQQTTDGGYIFTGQQRPRLGMYDIYLIKTDNLGDIQFHKKYDGFGSTISGHKVAGYSVKQTYDDGYIITGEVGDGTLGEDNLGGAFLIKTDSEGNTIP